MHGGRKIIENFAVHNKTLWKKLTCGKRKQNARTVKCELIRAVQLVELQVTHTLLIDKRITNFFKCLLFVFSMISIVFCEFCLPINKCSFNQIASTQIFRLIAEIAQHKITISLVYWSLKMHFPHDYAILNAVKLYEFYFINSNALRVYFILFELPWLSSMLFRFSVELARKISHAAFFAALIMLNPNFTKLSSPIAASKWNCYESSSEKAGQKTDRNCTAQRPPMEQYCCEAKKPVFTLCIRYLYVWVLCGGMFPAWQGICKLAQFIV